MLLKSFSLTSAVFRTAPYFLVQRRLIRQWITNYVKHLLRDSIETRQDEFPHQVWRDKATALLGLVHTVEQADMEGRISPQVFKRVVDTLLVNSILTNEVTDYDLTLEQRNPFTVLVSPTRVCNLRCSGCYAATENAPQEHLAFHTFERIISDKRKLWGSCFTAVSGGEPFLWQSNGKGLLDLAERHPDEYFLVYTNGTLIDDNTAARMEWLGNVTPAISVEGFERETDARRGDGVHRKIREACERLRHYGVPFGISVTATKDNWEAITSDEFVDYYFYEEGAFYGWIFQYMPIGESPDLSLMVPPEQRLEMWSRSWDLMRRKQVFYADFWNSATASSGCISAGRPHGYFHIISNGDITPCVFMPYAAVNIYDIYKQGGSLNDVFRTQLFKRIREFQDNYAYAQSDEDVGNWLCPCPTRDHHDLFHQILKDTQPKPIDEGAEIAMRDPSYINGMIEYGRRLYSLTQPIWERRYRSSSPVAGDSAGKASENTNEASVRE